MSNYVVSAIKYRPQCFDDVVGQKALTSTLISAIRSGKLAHSYLFCGPRGVGKTTCARIFAKTINCEHLTAEGEACNECDSCVTFNEGRSFNVHEMDAASNNSVENIRDLIDQVQIPPQMGRYKVFIIDEVHMLSQGAFNAFLKTLEEPPSYAIFILATTEKQKIIPTILSRCQIYDFKRIEVDDIVYQLTKIANKEGLTFEEEALRVIAEKADGGMRDALSIFDQQAVFTNGNITYQQVIKNLNILDYSAYFKIYENLLSHNIPQALVEFNEVSSRGFDGRDFIDGMARHARNLLMAADERTMPLLQVSKHTADQYREQARKCNPQYLYKVMRLCSDCSLNYRNSRNKHLLVEITLIEAAQADDDSDAHGAAKSAPKQLKPIFTQTQPTPVVAEAPKQYSAPKAPASPVAAHAGNAPAPAAQTAAQAPQQNIRKINVASLRSLEERINQNNAAPANAEVRAAAPTATDAPAAQHTVKNFDDGQFYRAWLEFANALPEVHNDLAARMQAMRPKVSDSCVINIVCENPQVVKFMRGIVPELCQFMRQHLNNPGIEAQLSVADDGSATINPAEEFKKLVKENKCLAKLNESFRFELI